MDIFLKLTDSVLFELHDKSSPFNSTHYATKWRSYRDHRLCDVTSPDVYCTVAAGQLHIVSSADVERGRNGRELARCPVVRGSISVV